MEKIIEEKNLQKAIATFKVMQSKLEDLFKQNPVFWYDISLSTNNQGFNVIFMNCGPLTKFNIEDDLEVS